MKKILSLLLAMTLVITMSVTAVFADTDITVGTEITDVAGTPYGTAVNSLVKAGIVTGYPDGTFRPSNAVTRAEASKLIYEAYALKDSDVAYDGSESFKDLSGYGWAKQYIGWAAANGIVIGDGKGNFKPGSNVTVSEFLTMIIRSAGHEKPDMAWPADYITAAQELGLTEDLVDITLPADGKTPSSRGNCAIMLLATGLFEEVHPEAPEEDPFFKDASGLAFGFVTETGKVLNAKDQAVDMLTFKIGAQEHMVLAKSGVDLESMDLGPEDGLICLTFKDGEVTKAEQVNSAGQFSDCMMITDSDVEGKLEFYKVTSADDNYIHFETEKGVNYIALNSPLIVYTLSQESGEYVYDADAYFGQIDAGCYIAAFTFNGDHTHLADVVIMVEPYDVAAILDGQYFMAAPVAAPQA